MNLNGSCGIDAFLIESCPALYLLSLKLTFKTYKTEMSRIRSLDIFHIRKCFFHRGKC
jgi:hypothetical protein